MNFRKYAGIILNILVPLLTVYLVCVWGLRLVVFFLPFVIGCVNAPSLVQKVIKYCIEHEVTVDLETYEKNRNLIYGALTEYGFTCAKPDGAFYLFVKSPVENEKEFCEVAKKHHVLVVPGSSFACPGYVRLAYCV